MSTNKTQTVHDANRGIEMNRRRFLTTTAAVGGGMAVGFWLPSAKAEAAAAISPVTADTALRPENWYRDPQVPEINAWFTIGPDDTVTIRCQNVDIGTSIPTTNAMTVAEELQCDWNKVRIEFASPNRDAIEKAPKWTLVLPGGGNPHDPAGGGKPDFGGGGGGGEDGVYRHMGVGSSGNVRESRYYLQYAGAEGRERLLLAASMEWGVPVSELVAKDSVITHAKSKRRTTYGALAAKAAKVQLPDPSKIKIKPPDKWTLMGTEQPNREVPAKLTGAAKYAIDIRLPGMLYAAVKCCPVWGGDAKSYNFDAIRNMPGVHSVVHLPYDKTGEAKEIAGRTTKNGFYAGGVAVIADSWWHAQTALNKMPIEWDRGPGGTASTATIVKEHLDSMARPGKVVVNEGNVDEAFKGARIIEATYGVPYVRRARMEPGNAVVLVTDTRLDMWVGDQQPQRSLQNAAMLSGLPIKDCYLHMVPLGGGYGSSGNGPQAEHAVYIANTVRGRPVKMIWSREEDWSVGTTYSPLQFGSARAALDSQGYPTAIEFHYVTTVGGAWPADSRGLAMPPYWVPNYRLHQHIGTAHVPAGRVRATGARANTFYLEAFIDELAHAAGKDPLMYRRELIARNPPENKVDRFKGTGVGGFRYRDDWLRGVDLLAKVSDWGKKLPEGWAQGVSLDDRRRGVGVGTGRQGTICHQVHTVEVTKRGQVKVHRADVVFDTGFSLVNPLTVRKNVEGQMAWGISDALYQEINIKDGAGVENNFDTYPVIRMNEYPREVNVHWLKTDKWIEGAGEEAIPDVTAAIYNAIFRVTGKRIRNVPLKHHDLSWGAGQTA